MDLFEIGYFASDLKQIKRFFLDMEARRDRLSIVGLRGISEWEGFQEATSALSTIEAKFAQAVRISRFVNPELGKRLSNIYDNSPLIYRAPEILISVQVEEAKGKLGFQGTPLVFLFNSYARLFGFAKFKSLFTDEGTIPIRRMLVDIERLIPLVDELSSNALSKGYNDDEIFKPSNLDVEDVKVFVDKAIIEIESSTKIDPTTKLKLEEYLSEINAELVKDTPAWRKIVGGLIIVSTILSGVAAAPDALNSVNSAINYILGTSVEQIQPNTEGPRFLPNTVIV